MKKRRRTGGAQDPVEIGRIGGRSKSPQKVAAARRNAKLGGAKGGRPRDARPSKAALRMRKLRKNAS